MEKTQRDRLVAFVERVGSSSEARESFIADPVGQAVRELELDVDLASADVPLANKILLEMMQRSEARDAISNISYKVETKELTIDDARPQIARILVDNSSESTRSELIARWSGGRADFSVDDTQMIANVALHVDVVAVVTKAVIINSDFVFSGSLAAGGHELTRIANILAQGR